VLILFLGGSALSTIPLNGKQWGISILLGAISLPVAVLLRLIPNDFIRKFLPRTLDQNRKPAIGVFRDEPSEWNDDLENLHE
jgi:Ca2+-transporting ATPase